MSLISLHSLVSYIFTKKYNNWKVKTFMDNYHECEKLY